MVVREIPVDYTRALRQAVLRPTMTLEQLATHEGPDAYAVGAYDQGELVAVGFVAPGGSTPGSWRVRGMATAPDHRGRGAGTMVLDELVRHAIARGANCIWCNARVPARGLYERAGFSVTSEEFEVPDIGPHYVMEKPIQRPPARSVHS
ncbi:MAG TPA: GNAT family N-acetyltransferase [Nocardioides sp.]|nr:GNAT family N-acetyltransferase [Nocardioides sp.]